MKDLDRKIQEALQGSSQEGNVAEEQNVAEELLTAFRGRNRWLNAFGALLTFAFFGVAIWGIVEFFDADNVREQIAWGGLCLVAMMFVGFLKVYFWMEMHTNRILREVKRVELLLLQSRGE